MFGDGDRLRYVLAYLDEDKGMASKSTENSSNLPQSVGGSLKSAGGGI